MRRGCIGVGEVRCDGCQRFLEHGECYLLIEEKEGGTQRFCVDCCLSRGYADYKTEKGEQVLTFFPKPDYGKIEG